MVMLQRGSRNNNSGRNANNNNRSNNRNRNNNNSSNSKVKGACEEVGYHVFDCSSRKNIKACNETLKKIAVHVGTTFGQHSKLIKYVVEHLEDLDLKKPATISDADAKSKIKWFEYQEQYKRYLNRTEGLEAGKEQLDSLLCGQCTLMMQHEVKAAEKF